MIRFVIGRRKTGKSYKMIQMIQALIQKGSTCWYLVPEQSTLETETVILKELEIIGGSTNMGLMDVQVISFHKLGNLLLKKTDLRNKKVLQEKGQLLILSKVMGDLDQEGLLKIYHHPKPNLLVEILRVIGELDDLSDEERQQPPSLEQPLGRKIQELLLIRDRYVEFIREEYIDDSGYYEYLEQAVLSNDSLKKIHVFVDDFHQFTKKQKRILRALMLHAADFTISLCVDPEEPDLFEVGLDVLQELEGICIKEGLPSLRDLQDFHGFLNPTLGFLEQEFGKNGLIHPPSDIQSVRLSDYDNIDGEVRGLFESIVRLVSMEGYRYRDIRIVCNNLEGYRSSIKLYRRLFDVPIYFNESNSIHNHPMVKLLLDLVLLAKDNNTDAILDAMKTGYLPFTSEEIESLERYVQEKGIRYGRWNRPFSHPLTESTRVKVMELMENIRRHLKEGTIGTLVRSLYDLVESLDGYGQLNQRIINSKQTGAYDKVYIDTQTWNVLLDTLDQVVTFLGDQTISLKGFHDLLKNAFERESVNILPINGDEAMVIGCESAFIEKSKVVFLLGVNEGFYPIVSTPDVLFPLEEGRILEDLYHWKKDVPHKTAMRQLEVYYALTMATEGLFISYALSGAGGVVQKPAYVVRQLRQRLGNEFTEKTSIKPLTFSKKLALISYIKGLYGEPSIRLKTLEPLLVEEREFLKRLEIYRNIERKDGEIAATIVEQVLLSEGIPIFSVSKLESYGRCPYQFFINNGIRPIEERKPEPSSMDYGNVFHHVLEKIGNEGWFGYDPNGILPGIHQAFDEEFQQDEWSDLESEALGYRMEQLKNEGEELVSKLIADINTSPFKPRFQELRYGRGGQLNPYELMLRDGKKRIFLNGSIDRLDVLNTEGINYVQVMDYKINGKRIDWKEVRDGLALQLFVYMKVMEQQGPKLFGQPVRPERMRYAQLTADWMDGPGHTLAQKSSKKEVGSYKGVFIDFDSIDHPKNTGVNGISLQEYEAISKHIDLMIQEHSEGILEGRFRSENAFFYSSSKHACLHCAYQNICKHTTGYRKLSNAKTKSSDFLRKEGERDA